MNSTDITALVDASVEAEHKRQLALLKAVGLDRLQPEQRELALNLARRYDLDLLLKHLVLIDGRPYITRDGLLHIAHRSGVFDGIETTEPELVGAYWRATAAVYRKDMSRPFRYSGRYPEKGKNAAYGPEMATKVAEVAALRRAFDVSAPTVEERWEDVEVPEPAPKPDLRAKVAQQKAQLPAADPALVGTEYSMPEATVEQVPAPEATVAIEVVEDDPGMEGYMPDMPADAPAITMTNEEARTAFRRATALVPKDDVASKARQLFPGLAAADYTATHYAQLAQALGVEL
jgi:hypothetical protein